MGYIDGAGPEGSPQFNNSPQTVADFNRLRDLVVQRGNSFKGSTSLREAWSNNGYAAEGHLWYDTTLDLYFSYDGAGWRKAGDSGSVPIATFGTGWTGTSGYTPFIRAQGAMVILQGAVTLGANGSFDSILQIPAAYAPAGNWWLGHFRANSGASGMLHLSGTQVSAPSAYRTGSLSTGQVLPLTGYWFRA